MNSTLKLSVLILAKYTDRITSYNVCYTKLLRTNHFGVIDAYKGTFGVEHANILISLSQMSETLCILLIPFFLKRFGIKNVMLISMFAWVLRFGLLGTGNPGDGVWMLVLSMLVYGVAFDFFSYNFV